MTDATEDWLGLGDEQDRRAAAGPALISHPSLGPRVLLMVEQMHRKSDAVACNRILFVTVNDVDGTETLEEPLIWQREMRWPREPTIAEVQQFQTFARASRLAAWWDRLAAANAEDEAERLGQRATKPDGGPERPGNRKAAPEPS
jgi:hypothetical protein